MGARHHVVVQARACGWHRWHVIGPTLTAGYHWVKHDCLGARGPMGSDLHNPLSIDHLLGGQFKSHWIEIGGHD
jgi:hypothetical protein